MLSPVKTLVFAATVRIIILLATSAGIAVPPSPGKCTSVIDIATGCNGFFSNVLNVVLGTVPGADIYTNSFLAIISLAAEITIVWAIFEVLAVAVP